MKTMTLRSWLVLAPWAVLSLAAACGGGGGGGQRNTAIAPAATIAVEFPGLLALTTDSTMTLRGTVTGGGLIADVEANGVHAATTDGFRNFIIDVPLPLLTNVVRITGREVNGRSLVPKEVTIEVAALQRNSKKAAFDAARRQVLVGNEIGSVNPLGLVALDLAAGRFVVVSGPSRGTGAALPEILRAVAVDPASDMAYVLGDDPVGAVVVFEVELASGNRRVVSDASSAGPAFDRVSDLDVDAARDRLVVADEDLEALIAVDVSTGTRTILSDDTHGSGDPFNGPASVHVIASQGRALICDSFPNALYSVDLATGNRSVISDANRGSGPGFNGFEEVAFDEGSGDALVVELFGQRLLRVDLVTGNREIISDSSIGSGPPILDWNGVTMLDAADGRAAVVDSSRGGVLAIDLVSGDREELQTMRIGAAERLSELIDIARHPVTGQVLASLTGTDEIVSIDPVSGAVTLVTGGGRGSGPAFDPDEVDWSPASDQAIVIHNFREILAVDLSTGDRTSISGPSSGSGIPLLFVRGLAVDDERRLAVVTDFFEHMLLQVDLVSGERTELSGPNRGTGPQLEAAEDVALDPDGITAWCTDDRLDALLRVDRVTGDRTIVSDASHGSGPSMLLEQGLAISSDGTKAFVGLQGFELIEVDLATGNRTLVSGPTLGRGPAFGTRAVFDPERNLVLAVDPGKTALVAIDPATGDRAVISY